MKITLVIISFLNTQISNAMSYSGKKHLFLNHLQRPQFQRGKQSVSKSSIFHRLPSTAHTVDDMTFLPSFLSIFFSASTLEFTFKVTIIIFLLQCRLSLHKTEVILLFIQKMHSQSVPSFPYHLEQYKNGMSRFADKFK